MLLGKFSKLTAVLTVAIVVSACAGTVLSPIEEEYRDTSGVYDGLWKVDVQKAAGTQIYGKWNMNCGDMRRTFNMRVTNGTMNFGRGKNATTVYVSADGKFKAIIPIDHVASATGTSSTTMANGTMKTIISGQLADEKSVGFITYGIAELGYGGCTAKTKFSKS